jgi:hypothetical protein
VCGELLENSNLGPQMMNQIAPVEISKQKPTELDAATALIYDQKLAEQREKDRQPPAKKNPDRDYLVYYNKDGTPRYEPAWQYGHNDQ